MRRCASRRSHAEPGLSPVSWLCRTRCTCPYASPLVAQGALICCTAAALPAETPQRADAAAQASFYALSRGRSVTTVPRQSSFPLSNRWRQPFRLVGTLYLVTQQSTLHTASSSSPPALAEPTPPGCNGSDSHFSAPITPAAAAEAGSTPRGVGPRKRQAKRAVASRAAVDTSAEQREEKGNSQGRQLSDASGEHRRPTDQSLSAAAPLQRVPQSAGKRESTSDSEFNILEALRLPAPPTRDNATPESICSYLLTLRRVVSVNRTGTHLVSITGRAALVFLRQILPSLMTMPPVPEADLLTGARAATAAPAGVTSTALSGSVATVKRSGPESGADTQSADTARGIRHAAMFAHPSFPPQSLPRASRQSTHAASPVSADVPKWYRLCGTGTVPWTEPLAEAVLLMCNRLNVEVRHLWIARAALLYLASVEGKDCADAQQPLPTTLGATPSRLTRTLASALKDKAQLALALMRTLDRNRRQSRLTREVLRPVAMRSALRLRAKQNGAASAGGLGGCDGGGAAAAAVAASVGPKRGDTRVSGMDGDGKVTTSASLAPHEAATLMPQHASSFVNLERYLADNLLPLLYGEFVHYCHAVEQWRDNNLRAATQSTVAAATVAADAAAAPAASRLYQHAPSTDALDDRAFLPNISRSDLESFSLLSAVLHRAIGLHGVVRCGDEVHFDLNEHSPDAYTPVGPRSLGIVSGLSGDVGPSADHLPCGRERSRGLLSAAGSVGAPPPPRSPQCQPAVPLRSFRITIEAVAARLDAAGGPHTGALESIAPGGVRPYAMDGYAIQIDSPPPFVPPHSATGAGVSRLPSDGSSGRFLSSSSSSRLRFGRPAAPSPARSPRAFSATAPSPAAGHKEHSDGSKGQDSTTRNGGAPHTTTTTVAPSFKAFGNFNVDSFLPILSLCLHDCSFHLLLTAAADDTGARDVVRCATGNTSSVSPATAAEVSTMVEEDVSALAAAVSRLLLLGVYWAPLCRTYQLPTVLALFARVTTAEPTPTHPDGSASAAAAATTMASLHATLSPPTADSLSTGATPAPLDTMVLRRVRGTLLPPSDSLATPSSPFVQQLCRLAYSSGCYMERVNFDTFARLTSILDRVLSQWPMQHADAAAAVSTCSLSDTTNVGVGGASGDGVGGSGGVAAATAATASSGGELLLSAAATSGQSRDTVARAAGTTSVAGTVGTAASHAKGSCAVFRAPLAAGMAVLHFFTPIAESFWSRERGRAMWLSIPRRTRQHLTATSSVPFGRAREKGFLGFNTYTYPYTQLRVSVPHVAGDATAAPDGVRDVLLMPLYVLRQMGMNVGGAERTSTPDELLRVYQTSERVESYMAVLNGVGCATAARPFICEYMRSDFMWRAIPNDAFAPLVAAVMELELTSMAVPELLSLSGSLADNTGPKHNHTASSSLQGRLSGCLSSQTMMSLNARVESHELRLLTAENEDTRTLYEETDVRKLLETVVTDSRHGGGRLPLLRFTLRRISRSDCVLESPPSSTTSAAGPHTDGPGGTASLFTHRPAPHQGAQGARKLRRFPGTPTCHSFEWMADLLWEPAYSRSSDESARLPLAALPPILRAMTLLAEAERRVDGASPGSRACYSGPESLSVHNVELILRMAYRLLFDTVAEASVGAEPPTVVSLEALVTLYLSLTSVVSQWGAASSPTRGLGSHVATPKPAGKSPVAGERVREGGDGAPSSGLAFMSLAVHCCLAHCEVALRPRLMAIAHDTLVSGMNDAAPMKRESVATDLRVLLQLAVLAEGLLPCLANMDVSVTAEAGASVNELIHRQLFRELGASLREASLQKIAGEVSRMLWWVTRRAHAEVKVEGALPLPPLTSWAETLLLREISAKRLPMADRAITTADATAVPSAASWCSGMGRQSFDLFEWALLPFYAKLEARQNVSNSAASAMTVDRTSAAPPRPPPTPAPMLDDFLSLEDAYSEPAAELAAPVWPPQSSSHGLATGFSSGATTGGAKVNRVGNTTTLYPSGPSAAPHTATLEAALHALPFQCDSFHVLLHIVRQLFLSHPALLSTAPEAVLYYELRTARTAASDEKRITATSIGASAPEHIYAATVGRKAWATLPVQRAELPHSLRQRYVDTLFRFFKRLVHHHSCTAEELVELLHLLWLADPHASHVTSSGLSSSSSSTTVSTSQWPSLFAHCSSFVKASLAELDAAAAIRDTSDSFKGDNDPGASSSLLRSVPEVLQTVYRTAHYGLAKSITVKSREMHWISVNAAALHPRSVVFFLQCLNTVVRGLGEHRQQRVSTPQSLSMPRLQHHEQQERTHHSLSCSHRSALELFQPFIICASITGEPMAGVAKLRYVPLMLEALSQVDPKLLLVVIQTVFTGAAWSGEGGRDPHDDGGGGGGGGGAVNSRREVASAGSGHFYRKALAGSQTGLGSTRMRKKDHIQFTRPSVAGGLQTSQRLSESIAATMAALLMVASYAQASSRVWAPSGGAGGDEDADSTVATTPATPQRTPLARISRAHRCALIFLRSSLFELLSLARSRQPLQCVSAFTVVQVMQLTVVQESPRLARLLEWILLSQLLPPVLRVERDIFPAATSRPPRCGSGYVATPLATLPKFSTPTSSAATPARHDSLQKDGVTITEDTIGRMRFPATHQSVLLLRLLPVQCWRSLLHRNVCWPRYRGYSLQVPSRRLRSPVVTRGETHTADTVRDRSIAKWNEIRSSLASLLLSLDVESIECLVAEAMGPMVLLVVTTELLRVVARQRTCLGDNLTTLRKDAEGLTRAVGPTLRTTPHADDCQFSKAGEGPASIVEPSGAAKDTPSPAALTSYEVVHCYASSGSVLTDEAVQPWLKAACNVIDQLASTRHADFVAVLEREAAWQRRVTEASTYQGGATEDIPLGVYNQTAVEAMKATRAAVGTTRGGAPEDAAPVLDIGEDGLAEVSDIGDSGEGHEKASLGASAGAAVARDDLSALGSGGGGGATTMGFVATKTTVQDSGVNSWLGDSDKAAAQPLVLDWRPIAEFMRVVRQVDPGISQRQVRLEWWMRQPALATGALVEMPVAQSAPLAEATLLSRVDDAQDVLHNAISATLQHTRQHWQAADRVDGVQPLLVMNLRDALNIYPSNEQNVCSEGDSAAGGQLAIPMCEDGAAEATSGLGASEAQGIIRDSVEAVEQARWLEYGADSSVFVDGSSDPATSLSGFATTMVLGLARPCSALSVSSIHSVITTSSAATVDERKRRRLALLRRAGVLASVQEMEQRYRAHRLSGAMWHDGTVASEGACEANFWRRKSLQLQREMLRCIFGGDDSTAGVLQCSHASDSGVASKDSAGAAGEEVASTAGQSRINRCISDLERSARHRLQLLRCNDLAQLLLLLLTSATSAASPPQGAQDGMKEDTDVSPSLRGLQIRVVMDTMAELLPSASTGELMQVALALLKLSISATTLTGTASTDVTTPQLLHEVHLEARRLLANVAVLVANDVERFTLHELLWLITRLHTPCIRAAPAVAVPPHAQSTQQADNEAAGWRKTHRRPTHGRLLGDEPLDVSMSYVSVAVARAIRVGIEDSSAPTGGERGDNADADDEDDDGAGGSCDEAAVLDGDVSVHAQSVAPVTVAQWVNAVTAAERLQGRSHLCLVLRLVERSAV